MTRREPATVSSTACGTLTWLGSELGSGLGLGLGRGTGLGFGLGFGLGLGLGLGLGFGLGLGLGFVSSTLTESKTTSVPPRGETRTSRICGCPAMTLAITPAVTPAVTPGTPTVSTCEKPRRSSAGIADQSSAGSRSVEAHLVRVGLGLGLGVRVPLDGSMTPGSG